MPAEQRTEAMAEFLRRTGWGNARIMPQPGDASTRRYARLILGTRSALLMDQAQDAETAGGPVDATPEQRQGLGYNAVARLAGGDCGRFVAVAEFLRTHGFSAPQILDADTGNGFVVLEYLGDALYADMLNAGADERLLYGAAAEVLAKLHGEDAPAVLGGGVVLHAYDETALLAETDLMTEWYFPLVLNRAANSDEIAEHRALWWSALTPVPASAPVFVHRDYHAQNLLWLPDRANTARVGLIDFQDAVRGSRAYDLVSLVEDARRDVSPALSAAIIEHYLAAVRARGTRLNVVDFHAELAVMAAQRNAKIVGIFARLYKRDGKPRYLSYLPRVWNYLERDLDHPALAGLRNWYNHKIPRDLRMHAPEAAQ